MKYRLWRKKPPIQKAMTKTEIEPTPLRDPVLGKLHQQELTMARVVFYALERDILSLWEEQP